jgi:hypothetical protein
MPEFRNKYFLEILELMKSIEEKNKKRVIHMSSRLFELAKIFHDQYDNAKNESGPPFHFNVELSRSCSNFEYAYDYQEWENRLKLIHVFTCPYPIHEKIIWTSFDNEKYYRNANDRNLIKLTRKWLDDLLTGGSFYKKNKLFFSQKLEAIYFVINICNSNSIIKTFFYAKCKSRHIPNIISDRISDIFAHKFEICFNHSMVMDFLDIIARTDIKQIYNHRDFCHLDDICDFVLSKIVVYEKRKDPFSFKGRTLRSVIRLMNEWHISLINEVGENNDFENINIPSFLRHLYYQICKWEGMGIETYKHKTDGCIWTVYELRNSLSLYHEGKTMKNCVASYVRRCTIGGCSIFNVSCEYKKDHIIESVATLEVNTLTKTLVQAKGKYNAKVTDETMNLITQWAKANKITIDLK